MHGSAHRVWDLGPIYLGPTGWGHYLASSYSLSVAAGLRRPAHHAEQLRPKEQDQWVLNA